ncbi:MAG TPA: RdgB/HAM1 family non-canonical purine NTP pyrophosphatase [Acidobacteriaceae bacterium]|jgi:XTP/dITP diphosphohydrolase|nr:RdgB/HAM1 family non-canonical purine NTP pyrophosphatase [Acidobacteriaceae bacterium]
MVTLYAATSNPGKLRDFAVAAADGGFNVEPPPDFKNFAPPEENELTFAGNARLKALYYSTATPGLVLADDSGLEVDALGGEPGVRSARFAADAGFEPHDADPAIPTDVRNNLYLLSHMRGIAQRTARYRCALALAREGKLLLTAEGTVNGEILTAPRGTGGFGYDPLFWLPQLRLTMAEISLEQKHALSHRGRAFRELLPALKTLLP